MLPPSSSIEESQALYEKFKDELAHKTLSTENYELLLSLENKQGGMSLERLCVLAFQKEFKAPDDFFENAQPCFCCKCADRISEKADCLFLHGCEHSIHPKCLEPLFKID